MPGNVPLQIQLLGGFQEQTLVLTHVAELQDAEAASAASILATYVALHLPLPSNVSADLARLAKKGYVMKPAKGFWAVSPLGKERIRELMAEVSDQQLKALGQYGDEPAFGGAPHHLIPPDLAPAKFYEGIGRFLEGHPFDRNVFGMARFPREEVDDDPMEMALTVSRDTCLQLGLELHLADDRIVDDILFGNVGAAMWACRYGIAILENTVEEGLNYNAVLEAGAMLVTGRRCLILKDKTIPTLPTDLTGHIRESVNIREPASLRKTIRKWITKDLALA